MARKPSECTCIQDVRHEIDCIDQQIIGLLNQRLGYVREVVKYKEKTASGIEASDRRTSMLLERRAWAEENGLDPDVIQKMYEDLVEYFIREEKKMISI